MKKVKGLLIFLSIYVLAYVIGFFSAYYLPINLFLQLLVFDVVATVVIYIGSLFLRNASLYDAYWSLTPAVMLIYLMVIKWNVISVNPLQLVLHLVFIAAFMLWSWRLTINWVITFDDIKWIDWRYRMYRDNHPKLYPLINFAGIQMMPTLMVFAGFLSVINIMESELNYFSLIGVAIILLGVALEFFADHQMHSFLKENAGKGDVCEKGLWKYSRHPNYLGEILIWVGTFVTFFVSNISLVNLYTIAGPAIMIFLFEVISIPMMEKRQLSRREAYKDYKKHTSRLILLPRRK